jgi:hypothetical protein
MVVVAWVAPEARKPCPATTARVVPVARAVPRLFRVIFADPARTATNGAIR